MPSTLPSRRCSRSIRESSKPSRVEATASSRSIERARRVDGADQQAEPGVAAAADPAAQLVELGDAEPVGVEDHHHGRVGDVDADLDDGRRHEHVDLARRERPHHPVLVLGRHPPVQHLQAEAGERPVGELRGGLLDGSGAVLDRSSSPSSGSIREQTT